MQIVFELDPAGADEQAVLDGLIGFNKAEGGPTGFQPIGVLLKDDDGRTIGGLIGRAIYDWLFIALLHVPEACRGQGFGTQLMARAEAFARERGLAGIWVDTYHFQALGFYRKLGFTVFGTLEGHPRGGARYFLQKRFAPMPAD